MTENSIVFFSLFVDHLTLSERERKREREREREREIRMIFFLPYVSPRLVIRLKAKKYSRCFHNVCV